MGAMKKTNEEYVPRYFELVDPDEAVEDTKRGLTAYRYIRDYWQDRREKNWEGMPDLFGYDE